MRKEVLLAIFFGFIIGLIITFGIYTANKGLRQTQTDEIPQTSEEIEASPTPTLIPAGLTIYEPANQALIDQENTTIRGKALPKSIIGIVTEEEEILIETDEDGLFETEIGLIGGVNQITITMVAEDGQESNASLTLIYSTAKIE
ncbi:hypothetical protein KKD62_02220 [Patescibacteria group bacterium]|nr:hypothetical protein [Patescibacteria group bacterium]MBU1931685.1 hypothetical protein [Patescibacteria group bacterium]